MQRRPRAWCAQGYLSLREVVRDLGTTAHVGIAAFAQRTATSSRVARILVATMLACCACAPSQAAESTGFGVSPSDVTSIEAYPARVVLDGRYDSRQLILTARLGDGRNCDVTGLVPWSVAHVNQARVSPSGRLTPLADGETEVVASLGSHLARIPIVIRNFATDRPINFANQVVPIFTKLGCNSGGCHGKQSGQNGFRLSLLGFDPSFDYETLVDEGRGRRVFVTAPEQSLLLLKATGTIAHGGGRKLEPGSDEYQIVRRWIAAGAPVGRATDAVLTQVTVYPVASVLSRGGRQQLSVSAHYSDGRVEDVTRRAQYESNDTQLATADGEGLVTTRELSGEAAVMVRYQGQVAVFRATVPLGKPTPAYAFPEQTFVDRHTSKKWRELGLVPSERCTDAEFLRRASLDLCGVVPTPDEVRAFSADPDANKREKLVDRLVESEGYCDLFAHKWADILRVTRRNQPTRAHGTFAFHAWIRDALAADLPYDQFVRTILVALGDEAKAPQTVWYKDLQSPEQLVDDTAQVFLGMRIACAQCHHHPYEKWSQDDYYGLAAFFGRLRRKPQIEPGVVLNGERPRQSIYLLAAGTVTNKRTKRPAVTTFLDGKPVDVPAGDDPRRVLADWMTDAKNPYFARAVANRYWAHFFGRGIVDPLDDMRATNPPANPQLLDALAADLVEHGYRLKHLVRSICKSRTYQLSAVPNEFNAHDRHAYARYYPRRLPAEVLYDVLNQVLGSKADFAGIPADTHAPQRALALPDESVRSYFLDVFGRPQRLSACECERVAETNLAQVLHLLNSNEVQRRLSGASGRAASLAKDPRPDAAKVDDLFLWVVAHPPTSGQREAALTHIAKCGKDKKRAYEDLLWSLINTKEFSFNK